MVQYIVQKILYALIVIVGVMTVTFFINFVLPGDPARLLLGQRADAASIEAVRQQLGLDKPLYEQYGLFMIRTVQGDLGRSFVSNKEVTEVLAERFPATALLAITSIVIATVPGIILGIMAALRQGTAFDAGIMSATLLGISIPSFVAGILLLLLFGVVIPILPISGYIDKGMAYLVLPMLTLGLRPLSIIARVTRSSMLDTLSQDYVRTARAKGLNERVVVYRHALRNALNPVITTISSWFAALLAGAFFVEYVFNWPGIGTVAINAIQQLDYPLIQGTVLFTAVVFVVINMVADVLYALLDPKVKIS